MSAMNPTAALPCCQAQSARSVSMTSLNLTHTSMHLATCGRQTPHQAVSRSRHGKQHAATGRLAAPRAQAMPEKAVGAAATNAIHDGKVQLRVEDDKQAKSRSKSQQSSDASHVKPCYPPKTINCSDGVCLLSSGASCRAVNPNPLLSCCR